MAENETLTLREVAQVLRCSPTHVSHLTNGRVAGVARLPALTLGRRKLVRRRTLEQWMHAVEEQCATVPTLPETAAGRMVKGAYHA